MSNNPILEGIMAGAGLAQRSAEMRRRRWQDHVKADQYDRGLAFQKEKHTDDMDYRADVLDQEASQFQEKMLFEGKRFDEFKYQFKQDLAQKDRKIYMDNRLEYDRLAQNWSQFRLNLTEEQRQFGDKMELEDRKLYIHKILTDKQRDQQYTMHTENIAEKGRSQDSSQKHALERIAATAKETRETNEQDWDLRTDYMYEEYEARTDYMEEKYDLDEGFFDHTSETKFEYDQILQDARLDASDRQFGKRQEASLAMFYAAEANAMKRHGDNYELSLKGQQLQEDKYEYQKMQVEKISAIEEDEKKVQAMTRMLAVTAERGTDKDFANVFNSFVEKNPEEAAELLEQLGLDMTEGKRGVKATDDPNTSHIMIQAVDGGFVLGSLDGKSMQTESGVPGSKPVRIPSEAKWKVVEMLNATAQDESVEKSSLARQRGKNARTLVDTRFGETRGKYEKALGRNKSALSNVERELQTTIDTAEPESPTNPFGEEIDTSSSGAENAGRVRSLKRSIKLNSGIGLPGNTLGFVDELLTKAPRDPEAMALAQKTKKKLEGKLSSLRERFEGRSSITTIEKASEKMLLDGIKKLEGSLNKASSLGAPKAKDMTRREWEIASLTKKKAHYIKRINDIETHITGTNKQIKDMKKTVTAYVNMGLGPEAIDRAITNNGAIDPIGIQANVAAQVAAAKKTKDEQARYDKQLTAQRKEMNTFVDKFENPHTDSGWEKKRDRAFYEKFHQYEGYLLPGMNTVTAARMKDSFDQLYSVTAGKDGGGRAPTIDESMALTQLSGLGYFMEEDRRSFTEEAGEEFTVVNKALHDAYKKSGYTQNMDYQQFLGVIIDGTDGTGGMRAKIDSKESLDKVLTETLNELNVTLKR